MHRAPKVDALEVSSLLRYLTGKGWVLRRQIEQDLGWSERKVRAVAEHADGQLLGTNAGYRLTVEASSEEMRQWDARYKSQIDRMAERRSATWIVFTRGIEKAS